jgi:uncharacterized protein (DUF433 family)
MAIIIQPETPPLRQDASGALRVGSSRVLVELVIRAFQDGATPEAIAQRYPTATLADIYAVIAYYLRQRLHVAFRERRELQWGNCAGAVASSSLFLTCFPVLRTLLSDTQPSPKRVTQSHEHFTLRTDRGATRLTL